MSIRIAMSSKSVILTLSLRAASSAALSLNEPPRQNSAREKDRQRSRLRFAANRAAVTVFFEEKKFPQNGLLIIS